jgi:enamine deaminase RidA (YjgF/YER057c/UK114 family)
MMDVRSINAPEAPAAAGGYAQAVEVRGAGRTLYISGQIPVARDGTIPTTFEEQAWLTWRNLEAQLRAARMTLDHLRKVTIFLSSRRFAPANQKIRRQVLGSREPALTVIITGIFDEAWLLEIEAIAAD